jgi:folate-binding protein YgfZ
LDALVFSEDVQITDMDGMWTSVSVAGPSSAPVLTRALNGLGADPVSSGQLSGWAEHDHATLPGASGSGVLVVASHHYAESGFDLHAAETDAAALRAALRDAGARPIDAGAADLARIERGRPVFGVDMDHETIPLEAGLEARAISLTKGCYVGQEVIIRVLHRGHGRVARRLVGLVLDAGAVGAPGDPILAGDRSVGHVTSAAWSPARGRFVGLGYVHRDSSAPGTGVTVRHGDAAGRAFVRAASSEDRGDQKGSNRRSGDQKDNE